MKATLVFCNVFAGLMLVATNAGAADDWYPSKWGKDDTLGGVNEITEDSILAAAKLIKTGKRYALGQESSRDTPAYGSRTVQTFIVSNGGIFNNSGQPIGSGQVTGNDGVFWRRYAD